MTTKDPSSGPRGQDPLLFGQFCRVAVPDILTNACRIDSRTAMRVGRDIQGRAESYAALDNAARNVLMSPFAEEVAGYDPPGSPVTIKGAVAVVVRSSLLEDAHSRGLVSDGSIAHITTSAAAPLTQFLSSPRRPGRTTAGNEFTRLETAFPRAWACLGAVALALSAGGGRWPYRHPAAPVPDLPIAEVEAPRARSQEGAVVLSGIDPRFDEQFVEHMRNLAGGDDAAVLVTQSLSRISRHLGKCMQAIEYLLAHDVPILTANYLLRPGEVWVRRGRLRTSDRGDPFAPFRDSRGLSGAHRAAVSEIAQQL